MIRRKARGNFWIQCHMGTSPLPFVRVAVCWAKNFHFCAKDTRNKGTEWGLQLVPKVQHGGNNFTSSPKIAGYLSFCQFVLWSPNLTPQSLYPTVHVRIEHCKHSQVWEFHVGSSEPKHFPSFGLYKTRERLPLKSALQALCISPAFNMKGV